MAPLNPNVTARWYLDYRTAFGRHTMEFRTPNAADTTSQVAAITAFINALKPVCYDETVFDRLRRSAVGSNLSFAVPWTSIAGTHVGTQPLAENGPRFISWVGRGPTGRRVRITLFGTFYGQSNNYRLERTATDEAFIALDLLRAADSPFVAIDGGKPVWNDYVNVGYNAYFQRKQRRTQ